MRISIELVPRSAGSLAAEAKYLEHNYPQIHTVNIPDLLRMEMRSWDACNLLADTFQHRIPHIRAMDFGRDGPLPFLPTLRATGINEIVLITGDPPQNMVRKVHRTTPVQLLAHIRAEAPELKVYAAVDPYRQSLRDESDYLAHKIEAGFDGYFTQPFFDLRMMEIYADLLQDQTVFWGISPVVSEGSQNYWETKNNVVFPRGFAPTLDWNIGFAREALAHIQNVGDQCYFMPIRVKLEDYLPQVLG